MENQYELTIIMSNYNQEEFISKAIESVYSQVVDFRFKLIITDDYSCRDKSKEIIEKYVNQYDNIEPLFSNENSGYLKNVLRAKARTKTKYFCLLDADDFWTDSNFLQRAYDFLSTHDDYVIYEANVEVMAENKPNRPFISPTINPGTYSKEKLLNNEAIPITQTTGMVFRNSIFIDGIPEIMTSAIGTRSERSFEGDKGRFIMHLKYGPAYYDNKIVGVYRITKNGIWASLKDSEKALLNARAYLDFYRFYETNVGFFVNKAFPLLQNYLVKKQNEFSNLNWENDFVDENERLMLDEVCLFCKQHASEIIKSELPYGTSSR